MHAMLERIHIKMNTRQPEKNDTSTAKSTGMSESEQQTVCREEHTESSLPVGKRVGIAVKLGILGFLLLVRFQIHLDLQVSMRDEISGNE
jgi:hypothetical protein